MCGRYSVLTEKEIIEIRSILQDISMRIVRDEFEDYEEKIGEVRPTDSAPVITMDGDGLSFENIKWGFKKWQGSGVIINARSESLDEKPMFAKLLSLGRCVVPASEYYEWEKTDGGKRKHYIKDTNGNLLFMAGLFRETSDGKEFVIITKDAVGEAETIHDRMPVILRADQIELWFNGTLSPDDITDMGFNVTVKPCNEGNENGKENENEHEQLQF
jgi:putative SOS response-associated peptidase YedK